VLRGAPGWAPAGFTALTAALVLCLAGVAASRAYGQAAAGIAFGAWAMPYAFIGGALLVATNDPVGVFGPARWIGAPQLLVGSAALLLAAVLGAIGVAAGLRVFAAGGSVGLLGALTALVGFFQPAAGSAALLMSVLICGVGALPLLAIRFGKLPMPPLTPLNPAEGAEGSGAAIGGGPEGVRERPDRERVFSAVARTEELLTGLLMGHAVLAGSAAVVLVLAGGFSGRLLVAVSAAALLVRSRLFVTVRQRVPLVAAGLGGLVVLAVAVTDGVGEGLVPGVVAGGLLLALLTVAAGATYSRRPPTPYLGRAADLFDTVMVVSVVPVACAVLGLYARARGLLG